MKLHGRNLIAGSTSAESGETFNVPNSIDRESLAFHEAGDGEVDRAARAAAEAFEDFRQRPPQQKAALLERIAAGIEALGDALIERANGETSLGVPRLTGERVRTCNQLRMFARLVEEGSWVQARIDRALPDRKPLPKPRTPFKVPK